MAKRRASDAPTKPVKSAVAHVRLTPDVYAQFQAAAEDDQRTLSDWLRLAGLARIAEKRK